MDKTQYHPLEVDRNRVKSDTDRGVEDLHSLVQHQGKTAVSSIQEAGSMDYALREKSAPTKITCNRLIQRKFSQLFSNEFYFAKTYETTVPAYVDRVAATIAMTMAIKLTATTIP